MIRLLAALLLAATPYAFGQRTQVAVTNVRGDVLDVSATQAGAWSVGISTGVTVNASATVSEQRSSFSVASGTGFTTFDATGTLRTCAIIPPSEAAVYDFSLETNDADAFPVMGRVRLVGTVSLMALRIVLGSHKAIIDNASQDGTYKLRCLTQK